ncbi:MAG TPA: MerR family transcriptional regulator [Candidatus Desulfofervidus auxilii]|uniref:MerR family transcriptional regulator n=1 Tax=Desulfofervidus auxilii TaxID=1621989 RepID=A0A7C0U3Z2_DESA2|nr:MerR family transcriptional regulator [Candidatus Desulfofervidus auxilii]
MSKNKKYFKISEVSKLVGLEPYILRFWEREFKEIKPIRFSSHRLYTIEDIKILLEIKKLLYEEGFTISGAKKQLSKRLKQHNILEEIREELKEILKHLGK